MKSKKKEILSIVKTALKEDIGPGDITTRLTVGPKKRIKTVIQTKENGIVCGLEVAKLVFKQVDRNISFRTLVNEGKRVKKGQNLAQVEGKAAPILKAERVALNFLGRLSGIATKVSHYLQKVKPYKVKIMDTRKTTPGLRVLEKYAVRCAGGYNHRMGLWDQVLIKDNHLFINRGRTLTEIISRVRRRKPKSTKIEIEVKNLDQLRNALFANPDIIMLDNFSLSDIKKAVEIKQSIHTDTELEVSGRVTLENVHAIAACGVERISIGELTHSVKTLDLALNCE